MILCFPLPVIVGVRTKFREIKQLERKNPTLPNNLTNIISDKEDNEVELLTLCQNLDMPSFDQIFDEEKMDRIHTDDVQVEVEDSIEKKMIETIEINTALCDLISAENVIQNLNIYINWIKNWLMLDRMFDNESALDLMKTIKNAIRRAYSTSKYKRRKLNKLWLNLRVYFHLYAAIDQQLSSRMIEDTVEDWEDAVLDWVKVRLFVRNFLEKLNEFGKMAAELGIEQMHQEQCGKL
uniref:Plasmodium RESA N-terminal domain-containing protein n=1 Tax=Globodera rostochiensis TaxID=31243 RepID=A0A914HNL1_GLORO